ncbi:MAG: S1 RNA-binding domain-containing protein [Chloroflexi bacterium]|nr:MAG: S1 RNA-binding domain-containing protein [Chloroflexota bacterium]
MSEESTITTVETPPETTPKTIHDLKRKMKLKGVVKRLELYGAFIDVGVGVDALIHISQLGPEPVNRVADVLSEGDEVTVWVDKVIPERNQIMVTMIEPIAVEWSDLKTGQVYTGKVTRLENFGAFVDIGAEREGLVHISELSHDYVKHPSEVVKVGDEVQVQVLSFSKRKRRIDLSIKALLEKPEPEIVAPVHNGGQKESFDEEEDDDVLPTAMEIALRKALGQIDSDLQLPSRKPQSKRRRKKSLANQEDILHRTLQLQREEN